MQIHTFCIIKWLVCWGMTFKVILLHGEEAIRCLIGWKPKCCLIAQQWLTGSLLCRQLPECFDWTAPSSPKKTASKNLTLPDTIHDMGCSRYDWLSLSYNCWSQTKTGWMACSELFNCFQQTSASGTKLRFSRLRGGGSWFSMFGTVSWTCVLAK